MQGNGGRENHIRDVSPCEFGRIISAQTPRVRQNAAATNCRRMIAKNYAPLGYIPKHSLTNERRMRTSKNSVPLIPLKDFGPSPFLEHGIFIEAFEDCVGVRHTRMEVHRHDYVEFFWLRGYGSVLIDF